MKTIQAVMGSSLLLFASIATAVNAPKTVATIGEVSGSVLIEHADQRTAAEKGMSLVEGDTIFVLEKATIDLAYAECNAVLEQNTLLTISATSPCATGMQMGVGQAAGTGAAAGTTGLSTAAMVAIGVAAVGVAAAASGGSSSSSNASGS